MNKNLACTLKNAMEKYSVMEAPVKTERYGKHVECILPIGNDAVAFLTMTEEAYVKLLATCDCHMDINGEHEKCSD